MFCGTDIFSGFPVDAMPWRALQDYGMLTIVNQQPDVTALQVQHHCNCYTQQ
jgi:hypothetical protein